MTRHPSLFMLLAIVPALSACEAESLTAGDFELVQAQRFSADATGPTEVFEAPGGTQGALAELPGEEYASRVRFRPGRTGLRQEFCGGRRNCWSYDEWTYDAWTDVDAQRDEWTVAWYTDDGCAPARLSSRATLVGDQVVAESFWVEGEAVVASAAECDSGRVAREYDGVWALRFVDRVVARR